MAPGFRRRILIEPEPGRVRAELEDDYHRMVVTLRHHDGVVTEVEPDMIRWPWTTCRGAIERCKATFSGKPLADFPNLGQRPSNCTHLHDLALFAAAHATDVEAIAYDIHVSDPRGGWRIASLSCTNGTRLEWQLEGDYLASPSELAGLNLAQMGNWVRSLDPARAEAARMLRWSTMIAHGRQMDIPPHSGTDPFPLGSCHTFSAEIAPNARRLPGADIDFSAPGRSPMSDRADRFPFRDGPAWTPAPARTN